MFSTRNWCLVRSVSFAARSRARGSTEPPGGNGTTKCTGLEGQSWASEFNENASNKIPRNLEAHIASSFQFQHLARLVRRCHGEPELFDEPARLRDLLGVGFGEL